jgi:hypothetical protein
VRKGAPSPATTPGPCSTTSNGPTATTSASASSTSTTRRRPAPSSPAATATPTSSAPTVGSRPDRRPRECSCRRRWMHRQERGGPCGRRLPAGARTVPSAAWARTSAMGFGCRLTLPGGKPHQRAASPDWPATECRQ